MTRCTRTWRTKIPCSLHSGTGWHGCKKQQPHVGPDVCKCGNVRPAVRVEF